MKTCTLAFFLLLSAFTSYAAAPSGGNAGKPAYVAAAGDPRVNQDPFTFCVEAEKSNGDGGISVDPNASGNLARGMRDSLDYFVTYATEVPRAGKYLITLRYFSEQDARVNVSVNNEFLKQIELPNSGSWNIAWKDYTFEVNLRQSTNSITITELPGYNVKQDKTCWTENGPGDPVEPVNCDYHIGLTVSDFYPSCGQGIGVVAECGGEGCGGISYTWSGPGLTDAGSSTGFYAPMQNGVFTYAATSSKAGCPDKVNEFKLTITDCGNEPFKICVEAEDEGGTGPITEDPNASGGKTRGAQDRDDYGVFYLVHDVQVEGPHAVTFRYYAEANTAVEVRLNSEVYPYKIELPSSNSWNITPTEYTLLFALKKGLNAIYVKGLPGYSPVRQDKICVEQLPNIVSKCDFDVTAQVSTPTPECGAQLTFSADCNGPDCAGVNYNWYGDGFARYTKTFDIAAPFVNRSYGYNLSAEKDGCSPKIIFVPFAVSSCGGSEEPFTPCIEAEQSASNGLGSDDPNASNGQTRGAQDNYDYYVDYQVHGIAKAGFFPVTLRYYAEANAQVSISVNGTEVIPTLNLAPTYSWNIVTREETVYLTLFEGTNTIRIQGLPGTPIRQDKICIGEDQNVYTRMAAPGALEFQSDLSGLQAYPNPAPGEFKAVFQLPTGTLGTMRVTDTQGRVWHERAVKGKGMHEEHILLPDAPTGIYLLQIKKPDSVETKKILLTH